MPTTARPRFTHPRYAEPVPSEDSGVFRLDAIGTERCSLCHACVIGGVCENGHTPHATPEGAVWS